MKRWMILLAVVMLSWGGFKGHIGGVRITPGKRFEMAGVKYFGDRSDAEKVLQELLVEWPAAKIVPEMFSFKIAGDFACTKYLHEDGHVY